MQNPLFSNAEPGWLNAEPWRRVIRIIVLPTLGLPRTQSQNPVLSAKDEATPMSARLVLGWGEPNLSRHEKPLLYQRRRLPKCTELLLPKSQYLPQ
jgi:hypothetical protein